MRKETALYSMLRSLICILLLFTLFTGISAAQDPTGRPDSSKKKKAPVRKKPAKSSEQPSVFLTLITDPPECEIFINNSKTGDSNGEGRFLMEKLPLGRYTIEVRKEGYFPASREFQAGFETPTFTIILQQKLDAFMNQFDSLVQAGKMLPPNTPNAYDLVKNLTARFPSRSEVQRMRTELGRRLIESINPLLDRTKMGWRGITREELSGAADTLAKGLELKPDDKQGQTRLSFLNGLISFRDWEVSLGASGTSPGKNDVVQTGGLAAARTALEKTIQDEETWMTPRYYLGLVCLQLGDNNAAVAAFSQVLISEPNWADPRLQMAFADYLNKNYQDSMSEYQKIVTANPGYYQALAGLGLARSASGDSKKGLKEIQRAIEMKSSSGLPHLFLGMYYSLSTKSKDWDRAETELKKAIQMNPQNAEFYNINVEKMITEVQKKKPQKKK